VAVLEDGIDDSMSGISSGVGKADDNSTTSRNSDEGSAA
jgi:hypothetical protein